MTRPSKKQIMWICIAAATLIVLAVAIITPTVILLKKVVTVEDVMEQPTDESAFVATQYTDA